MASCMGAALRRQLTVRPDLVRATRPASDKTSRCFMIAGSDTANGSARALIERSGSSASRANNARRVGSASAAKVRSSGASLYLTMWLRIGRRGALVKRTWTNFDKLGRTWTPLGREPTRS